MALEYRNELKYVVSVQQMAVLRSRARFLMALDEHAGGSGKYNIRSVYFDDYRNNCYFENEDGTSPREKFRIRIYNAGAEEIHLEEKRKEGGKTHKDSCLLSIGQCNAFLEGRGLRDDSGYPPVLRKFSLKYRSELYRPKVIVEYEREPYVYEDGNVRVTFDTFIRSSNRTEAFFEKNMYARSVMPAGFHLLEVKYDEFLPDILYNGLQMDNLQQETFSKYYLCRRYSLGGVKGNGF